MRMTITGGTGFVGLAIAEALIARGDTVSLFGTGALPPAIGDHPALRGARFLSGDVRSAPDLALAIEEGTDVLIHGAAVTPDAAMEAERPRDVVSVNVDGTLAALSRAREAGVGRVVVLSSVAVYGNGTRLGEATLDEDKPPAPSTLYGITKLAAEQAAMRLGELWSMDVRVIRLGPAFGPWEYRTGLRPLLSPPRQVLDQALETGRCVLSRAVRGDFIHSRDAARSIVEVASRHTLPYRLFNLGGPVLGLAEWCEALAGCIEGFEWRIDDAAATLHPALSHDRAVLDSARIEATLGPVATTAPGRAAEETIRWLRETT
jgi:nucleoside-diphosphate-sugar epimerase